MDTLPGNEISWIVLIESPGRWLELPMLFLQRWGMKNSPS